MKNASVYSRKFLTLLRRIGPAHQAQPPNKHDPVTQLVFGFLQWNAPRRGAEAAMQRIMREMVDHNDLRVSHNHEITKLLGESYPLAMERSARMREALHEVFKREYIMSLDALKDRSKRDVRAYLESLPGVTPFVAAHVTLVAFAGHAVPVDDRLATALRREQAIDADATIIEITSFLEHQIRANGALAAHAALQAWVDAGTRRVSLTRSARTATTKKTATRKSTKKKKKAG
ncbi:MAG: hypothetical protein QGH33_02585 [Pirellulaceae bacterium]|nr:hypothetical protein [Pirellulaceae bacterium]